MANNTDLARGATFFPDLSYAWKEKAGGTISKHRLVKIASDGDVEEQTFNGTDTVGVLHSSYSGLLAGAADEQVSVGIGRVVVVADAAITSGQKLKAASGGRVSPLVDSSLEGDTIEDNVGLAFTNQPANDGVEMVSSDAADTTQSATIYYTRDGEGNTVFTETKAINGTTQVTFTDTDVQLVLAVEKSAATTGTITFREASANQTIATLAAGTLTSGKIAVTAGQTRAYNVAPTAVANLASTKTVGIIGTSESDATLYASIPLTGTTPVTFPDTFKTVTFLMVGDLESTVTVTVKVGASDSQELCVGRALEAASAKEDLLDALILPGTNAAAPAAAAVTGGVAASGTTAAESGDAQFHVTTLTVSTTLPAIAGGAALGVGKLLYTLPAGACVIHSAKMALAITQSEGNITADTPDGGLGSVIASGVVSVLSGTATFEDILTGQTFNDCNGTVETKTVADQPMVMESGAAHTVHFNVADTWAASGDAAAALTGTVILEWTFLG